MPINAGRIELYCACGEGGGIRASVFYDPATGAIRNVNPATGQPPGTAALVVVNDCASGKSAPVVLTAPAGGTTTVNVPLGTTTRSAAQLAAAGLVNRSDVSGFSLSSP